MATSDVVEAMERAGFEIGRRLDQGDVVLTDVAWTLIGGQL